MSEEVVIKLPEGWLSSVEATRLAELARGKRVLELGAFKGRSTVAMAVTAEVVVSVDWHQGDIHTKTKMQSSLSEYTENIKPYPNIVPLVGRFEDIVPTLIANQFDMVFVDGQHDRESVQRDFMFALLFSPKVIAVHDWGLFAVEPALTDMGMTPDEVVETLAVFKTDDIEALHLVSEGTDD